MFLAIDRTVSPFKVDKVLWLICSGNLYLDNLNIGRHKDEFIKLAQWKIKEYNEKNQKNHNNYTMNSKLDIDSLARELSAVYAKAGKYGLSPKQLNKYLGIKLD